MRTILSYTFLSPSSSFSLSVRKENLLISLPITYCIASLAIWKFCPSIPFKLIEITGNFPIYLSHNSFSSESFKDGFVTSDFKKDFEYVHIQAFSEASWAGENIYLCPAFKKCCNDCRLVYIIKFSLISFSKFSTPTGNFSLLFIYSCSLSCHISKSAFINAYIYFIIHNIFIILNHYTQQKSQHLS